MNTLEYIEIELELMNKYLESISKHLEVLSYVQFAFLKKQNLDINTIDEDLLRSIKKCKS